MSQTAVSLQDLLEQVKGGTGRLIAVQYRHKIHQLKIEGDEGEKETASETPTRLGIYQDGEINLLELNTRQEEIYWLSGVYPTEYKKIEEGDDVTGILPGNLKWRTVRRGEEVPAWATTRLDTKTGKTEISFQMPIAYDGLKPTDVVVSIFGGAGTPFMIAAFNKGVTIYRIGTVKLKGGRDKDDEGADPQSLLSAAFAQHDNFLLMREHDKDVLKVVEAYRQYETIKNERLAAYLRALAYARILHLCQDELDPNLSIEEYAEGVAENDPAYQNLLKSEGTAQRKLAKMMALSRVHRHVFEPIRQMGPSIAGDVLRTIVCIERFPRLSGFIKYCGLAVQTDGNFTRRRAGSTESGYPNGPRQALYKFVGSQVIKDKASPWNPVLQSSKEYYRTLYPGAIYVPDNLKKPFIALCRLARKFTPNVSLPPIDETAGLVEQTYCERLIEATALSMNSAAKLVYEVDSTVTLEDMRGFCAQIEQLILANETLPNILQLGDELYAIKTMINAVETPSKVVKKQFGNAHVHNRAIWRTSKMVAEYIYKKWWEFANSQNSPTVAIVEDSQGEAQQKAA